MAAESSRESRHEQAVNEMRTLLRDWREYDDTALIGLMEQLLQHYGFWSDDDHDASVERRARFSEGVPEEDRAYDGWSNEPQKRALTGRERDILTRILRDIVGGFREGGARLAALNRAVRVDPSEIEQLQVIGFVLDPRNE